ncbi:MAG: InlB B-repeat-containing protein [Treponema sp.]|jgi:uncharacterized repeat protein (TIGR02543 family)|nr:InlB B-repeat-containing protein [Treponema sp.]
MSKRAAGFKFSFLLICFLIFACENPYYAEIIGYEKPGKHDNSDITYFISYNANHADAAGNMEDSEHTSNVPKALTANTFTVAGLNFAGWNREPDGSGAGYYDQQIVSNLSNIQDDTVPLYAQWTALPVVTFNRNGGDTEAEPATRLVPPGNTVAPPDTNPTRVGYTFEGWYTEAAGINEWIFTTGIVTVNITLFAKWEQIVSIVTFESNGGSAVASATGVVYGSTISEPTAPTRNGYTFAGWYKDNTTFAEPWVFATDTVTENITLYANWDLITFTVTFESNGGSAVAPITNILPGDTVTAPANPTRAGWFFGGWWRSNDNGITLTPWNFTIGIAEDITLYAKWCPVAVDGFAGTDVYDSLEEALASTIAAENYTVRIAQNQTLMPTSLIGAGRNITLTANNPAAGVIVQLSSNGSMFTVDNGVTLALTDGVTLRGINNNNASVVRVVTGGTFTMNGGEISGNINFEHGGGVYIDAGTFRMNGSAVITGNEAEYGGGVYIEAGTFGMDSGTISSNTAYSSGGGVYLENGNFTMSGSTISGNTTYGDGGGVVVQAGTFTVGGTAKVLGNTSATTPPVNSNVHLMNNRFITLGTGANAPVTGMEIWAQTQTASGVIVDSGAGPEHAQYFRADSTTAGVVVYHSNGQIIIGAPEGTFGITLTIEQITDEASDLLQGLGSITISRSGTPGDNPSSTFELTLANPGAYESIKWMIVGTSVETSGATFTLDANDIRYNQLGSRVLALVVVVDGIQYSRTISFTVAP